MSIKFLAYGYEWEFESSTAREVYMAFADHADGRGRGVKPSYEYVAWKIDSSTATVGRHVRKFVESGLFRPVSTDKFSGKPKEYWIDASKGKPKKPFTGRQESDQNDMTNTAVSRRSHGKMTGLNKKRIFTSSHDSAMPHKPINTNTVPKGTVAANKPPQKDRKSKTGRSRAELDQMFEALMSMWSVPPDNTGARKAKRGLVVKFREAILDCDPTVEVATFQAFTADMAQRTYIADLRDVNKFTSSYGDYLIAHPAIVAAPAPAERKNGDQWLGTNGTRFRKVDDKIERLDLILGKWVLAA